MQFSIVSNRKTMKLQFSHFLSGLMFMFNNF